MKKLDLKAVNPSSVKAKILWHFQNLGLGSAFLLSTLAVFDRFHSYLSRLACLISMRSLQSYRNGTSSCEITSGLLFLESTDREVSLWKSGSSSQGKAFLWYRKALAEGIPALLFLAPARAFNSGTLKLSGGVALDGALGPSILRLIHDFQFRTLTIEALKYVAQGWSSYAPLSRVRLVLQVILTLEVLIRTKPRCLLSVDLDLSVLIPCSLLGVQAVELSHGVGSSANPYFLYGLRTFRESCLDRFANKQPKYFALIGDDALQSERIGVAAIIAGYPYNFPKPETCRPYVVRGNVLVALSWGGTGSVDPWGAVAYTIDQILLDISDTNWRKLQIRMHPRFDQKTDRVNLKKFLMNRYSGATESNFTSDSLVSDLKNSWVVIANSSSIVVEASILGVPVAWTSNDLDPPEQLEEMGYVTRIYDLTYSGLTSLYSSRSPVPPLENPFDTFSLRKWLVAGDWL